ncbi:hypothetical protein LTR36_007789 [Oleoguttula mirabilis]|uniref:Uncharacterized protein n=1 Tax=Oleoguttula mirabilis TaxID=1507867 RepID=A0AAV9J9L7_9PEZI|nr:hypothetical protein LTR36_007789 [Oleoguttula mirabilis]
MASALAGHPLDEQGGFNWVYLVEVLVSGILALFFLFYFNRLFATVISYAIRAWTWHKYRAYIDISALQISLLGGRIFFKSVRYHAQNVTVLVHDGHITWRYWIRSVQEAEIFEVEEEVARKGKERSASASRPKSGSDNKSEVDEKSEKRSQSVGKAEKAGGKKKELPCRISVKVSGVEAFIYNRSPVYDMIVEATAKRAKAPARDFQGDGKAYAQPESPSSTGQDHEKGNVQFGVGAEKTATNDTSGSVNQPHWQKPEIPSILRMLPVKIECKRAAAAVGNVHTTSIITAKLEKAAGTIDAAHAGPFDIFKLLFNFDFENVNVQMKPNRDFKQRQLDFAQRILREKEGEVVEQNGLAARLLARLDNWWRTFAGKFHHRRSVSGSLRTASMKSVVENPATTVHDRLPGQAQWHGLSRYLDDSENTGSDEWQHVEYAKSSTLVDCPKVSFRFYWDIPGKVPDGITDSETLLGSLYEDDINGSKPPDYGLDFGVHGGTVVYGPWADRQRVNMQQIFFPASFTDAVPALPLKPGSTRVSTIFKIYVSVDEDVVLRVPTREPSKDGQWHGRADKSNPAQPGEEDAKQKHGGRRRRHHKRQRKGKQGPSGIDARPYGWLDITIKADTTVNYVMDMFARVNGFKNTLDLDVKGTEMTSSVNHGLLWRAGPLTLEADLSYALGWSSLRRWPFNIVCDDMELFILRDHMFLIQDIVEDWSSGPPPEFYTFVPFFYDLNITFRNFTMYLNVNDANIINDSAEFDKNDFLTLEGKSLEGVISIPLEHFRPKRNMITFEVLTREMRMRMLSPSRNTMQTLLKDKQVADLPKLTLKGSFDQNGESRAGLTDVLRFDIVGTGLNLKAYGQLVRQLINLKENYFGDYVHFKTLEEFQTASEDLEEANVKTASLPHPAATNELDVILCIVAEDVTVMLPTNLYNGDEYVRMELPVANLDLRIVSYYLDMGLNLSPLSILSGSKSVDQSSPIEEASSTQIYVSHVDLNGHRAFGLPPNEPAYMNTWDIVVGALTGECSSAFVHDLALAARAFIFAFSDGENALPVFSPNVFNDITFVQVRTDVVRLWMHIGKDALLVTALPISVDTNDWAGERFSQRINVLAPQVTIACVDGRSASRHRLREARRTPVRMYAFLQTGAAVDVVIRKQHFDDQRRAQQAHVRQSDRRTNRTMFLQRGKKDLPVDYTEGDSVQPAAMPVPPFPHPLDRAGHAMTRPSSIKSTRSFLSGRSLQSQKSSSSISSSIKGADGGRAGSAIRGPDTGRAARQPMFRSFRRQASSSESARSNSRGGDRSGDSSPRRMRGISGDRQRAEAGLPPSTMAFTSSFSEPYFPLDVVEPDETDVPAYPDVADLDDARSETSSLSAEIEDPEVDEDADHMSVFIKLEPGIRAYVEPRVGAMAANLIGKLLPKSPEDVMDAFHMDVMGTISTHQQERRGEANVLEIQASLPSAVFRVVNPPNDGTGPDQLDISIRGLEQMVRVRKRPSAEGAKQTMALHTVSEGVELLLGSSEDLSNGIHAIKARVDDILIWAAIANSQSLHVSIRDTNLTASGAHAKFLASLALKVVPLVNDNVARFGSVLDKDRKRLLLLIYTLTQYSEGVGDPPFLARMTYILRAFPDHYRNQESWKVLSRFRHILRSLPDNVMDGLQHEYKSGELKCAPDASAKVLDSWAQWRNWDVPSVNQTLAFRMLFSQAEARPLEEPEPLPLTLTVRSELLRIAIEYHSKVNEVVIEEMSLGVDRTPPTTPTGLMLLEENKRTKTLLQLHTSTIGFAFDWSVYSIVEKVLPLKDQFESLTTQQHNVQSRSATKIMSDELSRHDFHIVLSTDNGRISLQSINLRHVSHAEGMKMSLVGTTRANEQYGQCSSALVNVDRAVTELYASSTCIWQTLLTSPSIYIHHLQPVARANIAPSVVVAAAYNELDIVVKEQLPGILHVADSIIIDEVSKVMQLVKLVQTKTAGSTPQPDGSPDIKPATRLEIAMLAGTLHMEVSLLQALSYRLDGTAASVRLSPSLSGDKTVGVDFDASGQSHSFVNTSKSERHRQGILELPPINGHVSYAMSPDETSISVATTIERIEVDAAAIQSIMTVVNKPEVQHVFEAVQAGVADMKHHVADLNIGSAEPIKLAAGQTRRTLYDIRFALLGVRVATSTPQVRGRSTAEVEFGIGPLHATASNRATAKDTNQFIPEVRAYIQDIGARLWIDDRGKHDPCGDVALGIKIHFHSSTAKTTGSIARELSIGSDGLEVNVYPETASTLVDVINHLQDRLRHLDLSREVDYIRRLRDARKDTVIRKIRGRKDASSEEDDAAAFTAADLLSVKTTVILSNIKASWLVADKYQTAPRAKADDAVLSLASIEFTTQGGHEARLTIHDVLLQLTRRNTSRKDRALNSALLPEVGFSVAYWSRGKGRSLAFKATGKPLDLRLESKFLVPVNAVQRSVEYAIERYKSGTATWQITPTTSGAPRAKIIDTKRLASLLVEADFAGAQVYMQGSGTGSNSLGGLAASSQDHGSQHGRYGQFATEHTPMNFTLRAPGIALKLEYNSNERQPTVNGELQIEASTNTLKPNVVPLILEVSNSIKEVMQSKENVNAAQPKPKPGSEPKAPQKYFDEESIVTANPTALFGKTKVDLGLRICRQEFGLTCQPIARIDAKAVLDDFYFTMNTIESDDYGHFFAMSAVLSKLSADVKHVYSREPTFSFNMDSIVLSLMNSKHLSGVNGISAIIKVNPTELSVNGKQLQDLLLFREIWLPPEIRSAQAAAPTGHPMPTRSDDYAVQKYHAAAVAAAFPWNATVSITKLGVNLDLGQSIGKTSFTITNLWASQQKSSSWEQDLCVGLDAMDITSTGRMSGFIRLAGVGVRTSIKWPQDTKTDGKTPLIQASVGFRKLLAKAAFDYQAFAFGDIEDFDFLMYNVREAHADTKNSDRLVAVLDCKKAYVFCTSTSSAQAVGLYQAFDRLIQEKQTAYMQSLKDIEKHLRRESTVVPTRFGPIIPDSPVKTKSENRSPINLHTDVVLTLGAISFGVYPSTFFDSQVLKLEANNIQARFAVGLEHGRIHSGLGMTLGQLQVALASVKRVTAVPKALEVSVDEVINTATNAKGGIILRVPKVVASMQTWQTPDSNSVDFIFKSLFDGKIDVGWNLSRINFIKGMWTAHARSLAARLGKSLPESAVKITAGSDESERKEGDEKESQEKITAEVNLPQSRYEYRALEPPIIETPQLRDMGEATPPLEWVGLNRDRLPNVTHQIVIVSLLEVVKEVEDAYERILGSS